MAIAELFKFAGILSSALSQHHLLGFKIAQLEFQSQRKAGRHSRHGFDPWVKKIPGRRAWQPPPVFSPGECHGQRSLGATVHRVTESQTRLKRQSIHTRPRQTNGSGSFTHPVCREAMQVAKLLHSNVKNLLILHSGG